MLLLFVAGQDYHFPSDPSFPSFPLKRFGPCQPLVPGGLAHVWLSIYAAWPTADSESSACPLLTHPLVSPLHPSFPLQQYSHPPIQTTPSTPPVPMEQTPRSPKVTGRPPTYDQRQRFGPQPPQFSAPVYCPEGGQQAMTSVACKTGNTTR